MAGIDDINKADEALKGLSGRLGAMLDGALEKTGTLKDAFAQMKDSVPSDVWDHVNGQLDKTKTTEDKQEAPKVETKKEEIKKDTLEEKK